MDKKIDAAMNRMFNILKITNMSGNYNERKIGRYEENGITVSTAEVTDYPESPYETAISHPKFGNNCGNNCWIIVARYINRNQAETGHKNWVKEVENDNFSQLIDVNTDEVFMRNK